MEGDATAKWGVFESSKTGMPYFHNKETGESVYDMPAELKGTALAARAQMMLAKSRASRKAGGGVSGSLGSAVGGGGGGGSRVGGAKKGLLSSLVSSARSSKPAVTAATSVEDDTAQRRKLAFRRDALAQCAALMGDESRGYHYFGHLGDRTSLFLVEEAAQATGLEFDTFATDTGEMQACVFKPGQPPPELALKVAQEEEAEALVRSRREEAASGAALLQAEAARMKKQQQLLAQEERKRRLAAVEKVQRTKIPDKRSLAEIQRDQGVLLGAKRGREDGEGDGAGEGGEREAGRRKVG